MRKMSVNESVALSGAKHISGYGEITFTKVVTDSRRADKDTLFIGLRGENADGALYAPSAFEAGCRAMLLSDDDAAMNMKRNFPEVAVIVAKDTLSAMQDLARGYLKSCRAKKIAVTGSVGKTTTKEMCYKVLASKYKTICNHENFNNHIGVPLTAFSVEENTEMAIFEMGMNHRGEIRSLADIVRPDIAVITNIGNSHIGNLGSRDEIFSEKMDVTCFFGSENTLIYNSDNDKLSAITFMNKNWKSIGCGEKADEDGVTISKIWENAFEAGFTLESKGCSAQFILPSAGRHNAWNAALAAACGLYNGISLSDSAKALADFRNTGSRLKITKSETITIIDDTYNASPDSVKAAIDVLAGRPEKRKIAILADMLELGDDSDDLHEAVMAYSEERGIDMLIAVGAFMSEAAEKSDHCDKIEILCFKDKDEVIANIDDILKKDDVILVKGSHSMHMDEVSVHLTKRGDIHE